MTNTPMFTDVLEECYETKYVQEPNYGKIIFLLKKILMDEEIAPGGIYQSERYDGPDMVPGEENSEAPEEPSIVGPHESLL